MDTVETDSPCTRYCYISSNKASVTSNKSFIITTAEVVSSIIIIYNHVADVNVLMCAQMDVRVCACAYVPECVCVCVCVCVCMCVYVCE